MEVRALLCTCGAPVVALSFSNILDNIIINFINSILNPLLKLSG